MAFIYPPRESAVRTSTEYLSMVSILPKFIVYPRAGGSRIEETSTLNIIGTKIATFIQTWKAAHKMLIFENNNP